MKVYLAGKIGPNDWRGSILGTHRPGGLVPSDWVGEWPVLEKVVLGEHDYVGPYFISCDHGCAHGRNEHGALAAGDTSGAACIVGSLDDQVDKHGRLVGHRVEVARRCLQAIKAANLVFAWIDCTTAHGTLFEIGFAASRGLTIAIAHPPGFQEQDDLWFAHTAAWTVVRDQARPEDALAEVLLRLQKSAEGPW